MPRGLCPPDCLGESVLPARLREGASMSLGESFLLRSSRVRPPWGVLRRGPQSCSCWQRPRKRFLQLCREDSLVGSQLDATRGDRVPRTLRDDAHESWLAGESLVTWVLVLWEHMLMGLQLGTTRGDRAPRTLRGDAHESQLVGESSVTWV
jgi:hypothetical protein